MPTANDLRHLFRALHENGTFVMPNPYDVGTTKLLTAIGFPALATTSAGFASTLGRMDMTVGRDELIEHVSRLTAATHLPFNVDSERLYGGDAAGIAECVALPADAGASGCSIEDWNPATDQIDPVDIAAAGVRRVSLGSFFANVANAAIITAARQLMSDGTIDAPQLDRTLLQRAFTA